MWTFLKKLFARSRSLNALFGDVIFETQPVKGQLSRSYLQWRVRKGLNGSYLISVKLKPDAYMGDRGSVTNFLELNPASAEAVKEGLEECLAELNRLATA